MEKVEPQQILRVALDPTLIKMQQIFDAARIDQKLAEAARGYYESQESLDLEGLYSNVLAHWANKVLSTTPKTTTI